MTKIKSLRKKFVNSTLINKICINCNKKYPRTDEFFYKRKHPSLENAFTYENSCIRCENERATKWNKKNKDIKIKNNIRYKTSERGYFMEMFQGVKKSIHGCEFKNYDEFFQCWVEQQKIYGTKCPYTGIEMTRIRGINKGGIKKRTTETNISRDRILSSKPYSKENVMFVSWKINTMKKNISPKVAKQYLNFVKERFGTNEVE